MKKNILISLTIFLIILFLHWLRWKLFGIGLPAFFPYKNRFTQKCVLISGDSYSPPWFNLIYKKDKACENTTFDSDNN